MLILKEAPALVPSKIRRETKTIAGVQTEVTIFEGWLTRTERDADGDIIEAGAFADAKPESTALLLHHDRTAVAGKWLEFEQRHDGLHGKGMVIEASDRMREAAAMVRAGALGGLSVGFRVKSKDDLKSDDFDCPDTKTRKRGRRIKKGVLAETSIVTFPCQPHSRISKSDTDTWLELKSAGLSSREIEAVLQIREAELAGMSDDERRIADRLDALISKVNRPLDAIHRDLDASIDRLLHNIKGATA